MLLLLLLVVEVLLAMHQRFYSCLMLTCKA
jgi:hypothetical protein